ncbi:DUF1211 domain-containing protein [Candidatus Parcubacteria bacterium]|nr:DUF1211 domain-containing protein [Candidatus Parcubacteria bacterium]
MFSFFRKRKFEKGLAVNRTEAFSDGVFSIAITLLVFNLKVPDLGTEILARGELGAAIMKLWPNILTYIVSFAIIGIFWVGHHLMFKQIKRVDRPFLWLNVLFLMCISFIPFPASVIGTYPTDRSAVILYGVTLCLASFMILFMWLYASRKRRLVDQALSQSFISKATLIVLVAPIVYVLAILSAYTDHVYTSLLIYLLVPVLYIIPSPVDDLVG